MLLLAAWDAVMLHAAAVAAACCSCCCCVLQLSLLHAAAAATFDVLMPCAPADISGQLTTARARLTVFGHMQMLGAWCMQLIVCHGACLHSARTAFRTRYMKPVVSRARAVVSWPLMSAAARGINTSNVAAAAAGTATARSSDSSSTQYYHIPRSKQQHKGSRGFQ